MPDEEILSLKGQAEKFQFDRLNQLFGFLLKGEEEVAQSTFPRTMVEMALIRMAMLRPLRPIDEIIKKLEELGKTEISAGRREPAEIPPLKKIAGPDPEQKEGKKAFMEEPFNYKDKLPLAPREHAGDSEGSQERETFDKDSGEVKEEVWKGLVDFVQARKPVLGSSLILGRLVDLNQDRIEIGFEKKDSFAYETMIERERRSQLEELCRDFLKREVKVVISSLEEDSSPRGQRISGRRENNPVDEKEVPEKRMEEHPIIQEALRLFDGKIVKG